MEVHCVENQLLLATCVDIGLRVQLLIRYFSHDLQRLFDGFIQVVCVSVSWVNRVELRQICVLVRAIVYTWLVVTHEGTQKGSKLGCIQRVQYCLNDHLSDINVHLTGNPSLQSQCAFLYKVEIIQELNHPLKRTEKPKLVFVDPTCSLKHEILRLYSLFILCLMLIFQCTIMTM